MQLKALLLGLAATLTTALPRGGPGGSGSGGGGGGGKSCNGIDIFNDGSFAGTCNFAAQSCTQPGITAPCADSCPCDGAGCFVDVDPNGNFAVCSATVVVPG